MDTSFVDWFVHIDQHLGWFFQIYGIWAYAILFLIIFGETGFVVLPFLPGDTLLFAAGALSASMGLSLPALLVVIPVAAVLGNTVNFWIGRRIGKAALRDGWLNRYIKPHHLAQAHTFFDRWGGWAITFCRFIAVLRTITPFVAGLGRMKFWSFTFYNVIGSVAWGLTFVLAGFFFGNLPFVKDNFHYLVIFILFISTVPFLVAFIRAQIIHQRKKNADKPKKDDASQNS